MGGDLYLGNTPLCNWGITTTHWIYCKSKNQRPLSCVLSAWKLCLLRIFRRKWKPCTWGLVEGKSLKPETDVWGGEVTRKAHWCEWWEKSLVSTSEEQRDGEGGLRELRGTKTEAEAVKGSFTYFVVFSGCHIQDAIETK